MEHAVTTGGQLAARISTEMVGLLRRYTGRGPTKARTYVDTNLICVVYENTLTRAEHNLVAAGEVETVIAMRRTFHEAMESEATRRVEQLVERRVLAYLSDIKPEADIAVDTFVLEPIQGAAVVEVAEVEGDEDGDEAPLAPDAERGARPGA